MIRLMLILAMDGIFIAEIGDNSLAIVRFVIEGEWFEDNADPIGDTDAAIDKEQLS